MRRKAISIVVAITMTIFSMPMFTFAFDSEKHDSEIPSHLDAETVEELEEVNTEKDLVDILDDVYDSNDIEPLDISEDVDLESSLLPDDLAQEIIEATPEDVLSSFIDKKTQRATEIISDTCNEIEMVEEYPGTYTGSLAVDLGDNCYAEIEVIDTEDPSLLNRIGNSICPVSYAKVSRSGHSVLWKKYGKRYYTAKTKVFYGVAYGLFALENHYKLSASGITERYGTAWSEDSGLVRVSEGSPTIDTSKATKIGKSVCIVCTFKATYGYNPIQWTRSYKMKARVKYLAKDAKAKEIKVNQNWDFKEL